jgi:hypothetical protein
MASRPESLVKAGLLNIEAEHLSAYQGPPVLRVPFCCSEKCCGRKDDRGRTYYIARIQKKTEGYICPDCGHWLVWRKISK